MCWLTDWLYLSLFIDFEQWLLFKVSMTNMSLGYDRELPAFPTWSIIGDEQHGEFNFFIESVKLDDEGIFACEVSPFNDAPALKQIAHVRVLVQPTDVRIIDQSASNETGIVTMRFDEIMHQIHCRVDHARPAAHIKWFNDSEQEYPATSRTFMQGMSLLIMSVPRLAERDIREEHCLLHELVDLSMAITGEKAEAWKRDECQTIVHLFSSR